MNGILKRTPEFHHKGDQIMHMTSPYITTAELSIRLRCSSRTLFRRMDRSYNPLPKPVIKNFGSSNLWLLDEIVDWEVREIERSRRLNTH